MTVNSCSIARTTAQALHSSVKKKNHIVKKMWYIYAMEYYSAIKKNEIMPFAAISMDLEIIVLREINQTEKDKYHMISRVCGI